ncbi:MAG TPA: hypothetical protein VLC46_04035 [Thermoanaerobaculia bacterium]|nr:hypothetical protein [Thermoanaerobaculia bacterium]
MARTPAAALQAAVFPFANGGGFFVSKDSGKTYAPAGLEGVTVSGVAVNGGATRIYAATYASGI